MTEYMISSDYRQYSFVFTTDDIDVDGLKNKTEIFNSLFADKCIIPIRNRHNFADTPDESKYNPLSELDKNQAYDIKWTIEVNTRPYGRYYEKFQVVLNFKYPLTDSDRKRLLKDQQKKETDKQKRLEAYKKGLRTKNLKEVNKIDRILELSIEDPEYMKIVKDALKKYPEITSSI